MTRRVSLGFDTEQEKYGAAAAELDKLFCEAGGARVFKHIKRMFTLEDLGLKRVSHG